MTLTISKSKPNVEINSFPSEIELILQCASSRAAQNNRHQIELLLESEINWSYLLQMSTSHKVLALIHFNLDKIAPQIIPEDIRASFVHFYQINVQKNLLLTSELLKILDLYDKHQIPAIPLKGAVLARQVYSNFGLRTVSDIDIVVPEADFRQAQELLVKFGYKPHPLNNPQLIRQAQYNKPNTLFCIDLHYAFSPRGHFVSVDSTNFWDNLTTFSLADQEMSIFAPEHMAIYLCLEGAKEHWRTLNRICDLSELICSQALDWDKLLQTAKAIDRHLVLYLGLYLVHTLLNTPIPDFVWTEVESHLKIKLSKKKISNFLFRNEFDIKLAFQWHLFNLQGFKFISNKIKYLRQVIKVNLQVRKFNFSSLIKT